MIEFRESTRQLFQVRVDWSTGLEIIALFFTFLSLVFYSAFVFKFGRSWEKTDIEWKKLIPRKTWSMNHIYTKTFLRFFKPFYLTLYSSFIECLLWPRYFLFIYPFILYMKRKLTVTFLCNKLQRFNSVFMCIWTAI